MSTVSVPVGTAAPLQPLPQPAGIFPAASPGGVYYQPAPAINPGLAAAMHRLAAAIERATPALEQLAARETPK